MMGKPAFRGKLNRRLGNATAGLGTVDGGRFSGVGACGHIAIYHSPASVFIIAMPLQPSFRRKPGSSVVISYYCNGAGEHRFRLAPE